VAKRDTQKATSSIEIIASVNVIDGVGWTEIAEVCALLVPPEKQIEGQPMGVPGVKTVGLAKLKPLPGEKLDYQWQIVIEICDPKFVVAVEKALKEYSEFVTGMTVELYNCRYRELDWDWDLA